jgi:hypothetical protein
MVMRLSSDSARDKDTIANIVASKQISRTPAVNSFMVLLLFLRASVVDFLFF